VHEFGHHFAGLADEYYTSAVAYESQGERLEPWEPNATADPQAAKWRDLVTPGTPLPTPWQKEAFEALERTSRAAGATFGPSSGPRPRWRHCSARSSGRRPNSSRPARRRPRGRIRGALYEAKGYYRPQADCIMFTRDEVGFCAVCRRAIERVIALYTPQGH
jgi:hypothetical protein